jgi:hypothetical protein
VKIVSVKRPKAGDNSLKVYGKVEGDSGKVYIFGYFRRRVFRGWICSCENFFLNRFSKNRNCKHLRFVRKELGRYAASV